MASGTAAANRIVPEEAVVFLEDVAADPMVAAVAGTTRGTVEARHFLIPVVQRLNLTGKDDAAHTIEPLDRDSCGESAGEALPDQLGVISGAEELNDPRLRPARGAGERVLRNGNARHAEVIYRE